MQTTKKYPLTLSLFALGMLSAHAAQAQIKIGVILSTTGPAASLGIPEKNTIALLPKEIGGKKIEYIILDDASDSTTAVKDARKLTSEDKVDAIIGSTITPNSLAMIDVAAESHTPMLSLAASAKIIEPMDAKREWVFKMPQNDSLMAAALVERMVVDKVRSVGFIGFSDSYGEGWFTEFSKQAEAHNIKISAHESYARPDTSVTGQVLKIMAGNPDAVFIAGAGTPAVLPQKTLRERGYKGKIYQTHGVANSDFLRLGGKEVEGTVLPAGPMLVAALLPDSDAAKKAGINYTKLYEAAYGPNTVTTFGGHAWDAGLLLQSALPVALKKAQPGTPEFRQALRDALENVKNLTVSHGVFNMSKLDHNGMDQRARVMVKIDAGRWVPVP